MKETISYKNFFKIYGIFLLIVSVLFGLLFYFIFVSNKAWQNNLKTVVEVVLDEKDPNSWTVENNKKINSPLTMNSAAYEVRNRQTGELFSTIIIRVQTFYGPMAAVFLIDKNKNVEFVGYSSLHGRVATQLSNKKNNTVLLYWQSRVQNLID